MSNYGTYFSKRPGTVFVVKNIAPHGKRIRIFQYPIPNGGTRDLLAIPGLTEAEVRGSLLKGELKVKIENKECIVVDSNIDLLQFSDSHKSFLQSAGIVEGLEVSAVAIGALTAEQHKTLRQLIHLAEGSGPMEGFSSGAFRETLPAADPFPTSIIWWESSAKLEKIVEKEIVYDANKRPTTIRFKVYDTDGSLLATVSDAITYSGTTPFEESRVRTVS